MLVCSSDTGPSQRGRYDAAGSRPGTRTVDPAVVGGLVELDVGQQRLPDGRPRRRRGAARSGPRTPGGPPGRSAAGSGTAGSAPPTSPGARGRPRVAWRRGWGAASSSATCCTTGPWTPGVLGPGPGCSTASSRHRAWGGAAGPRAAGRESAHNRGVTVRVPGLDPAASLPLRWEGPVLAAARERVRAAAGRGAYRRPRGVRKLAGDPGLLDRGGRSQTVTLVHVEAGERPALGDPVQEGVGAAGQAVRLRWTVTRGQHHALDPHSRGVGEPRASATLSRAWVEVAHDADPVDDGVGARVHDDVDAGPDRVGSVLSLAG